MSEINKSFADEMYRYCSIFEDKPIRLTAIVCERSKWGKKWVGENNLAGERADKEWKGKRVLLRDTIVADIVPLLQMGENIISCKLLKGKTKKYIVNLWFKDYDSVEEAIKDQCFFWEEQDKYVNEINKMLHILLKLGLK